MTAAEYVTTPQASDRDPTWSITRNGVEVGTMFQGAAYGRFLCSMRSGRLPEGASDTRSEHFGIHFDTGPHDTREEALAAFARNADRLIAWREKEGAP